MWLYFSLLKLSQLNAKKLAVTGGNQSFWKKQEKHITTDWHPTWLTWSNCIWKLLELAHLTCPNAVTEDIWFLTRGRQVICQLTIWQLSLANTWLSVWHPVCMMSLPTQLVMSFFYLRRWLSPVQSMAFGESASNQPLANPIRISTNPNHQSRIVCKSPNYLSIK